MPAASPWMDQWAPPQWVFSPQSSSSQAPGAGDISGSFGVNTTNPTSVDTTLHWKVGGTVIIALIIVFGLQALGFRFVVGANTTMGLGK